VKIPSHVVTLLSTVLKGKGMSIPEGAEAILESDFEMPRRGEMIDFDHAGRVSRHPDVATILIKGVSPDGAIMRIFIQADGLSEAPSGLAKFMGAGDATSAAN
jgi:hypothetical protein